MLARLVHLVPLALLALLGLLVRALQAQVLALAQAMHQARPMDQARGQAMGQARPAGQAKGQAQSKAQGKARELVQELPKGFLRNQDWGRLVHIPVAPMVGTLARREQQVQGLVRAPALDRASA